MTEQTGEATVNFKGYGRSQVECQKCRGKSRGLLALRAAEAKDEGRK